MILSVKPYPRPRTLSQIVFGKHNSSASSGLSANLPDILDKLHSLKDYLIPNHNFVAVLSLANWNTTIPSIEKLVQWCTNIGVIVVVERKLSWMKVGIPTTTEINNTRPQHILECLDGLLTLSISLTVIRVL